MDRCRDFELQVLEYLYDLLDADQAEAVRLHLEQCAPCQTTLRKAKQQQQLLATAARLEFPAVQFEPPGVTQPTAHEPVLPFTPRVVEEKPVRRRIRFSWRVTLRIAASVLVLLIPAAFAWDYQSAQREVARINRAQAALQSHVDQLGNQQALLGLKRQEQLNEVHHAVRARQLKLIVSGPGDVQAGASNEYQIQTRDGNDHLVAATILSARVVDQRGQVLFKEEDLKSPEGNHRLTLPPTLPVKPGTQLSLEVVARAENGSRSELRDQLTLATPSYVTHLTTDKPMYNPGETVFFRSLTLERSTLKPAEEPLQLSYSITTPTREEKPLLQGQTTSLASRGGRPSETPQHNGQVIRGVGAGEWQLGSDIAGGEYVLTVREASNRFAPEERRFVVNNYPRPRLNKQLDFARKTYGPGDEVVASCRVLTNGGGPLAGRPVRATVSIDDQLYDAQGKVSTEPLRFKTDDQGKVLVRFKLPRHIERGQASLTVNFDDGGTPEPLVRTIPLVLDRLNVEFFPEGGDLVTGVPNRVYFQVETPLGKPADLKGRILDGETEVARIETLNDEKEPGVNQGQGMFTFTPKAGHQYTLAIESPPNIKTRPALPPIKEEGVVLHIPDPVTIPHQPIRVQLNNIGKERSLLVGAYCRGRLFDHRSVVAKANQSVNLQLNPDQNAGGVYRITVFEEQRSNGPRAALIPLAERLIYRQQGERLNLNLATDRKKYLPGERAQLTVTARGENQELVPALVLVSVVDRSVLTLADEKTARSMPTHFYLTSEVRKAEDLEYADFMLSTHPKAPQVLDLLLGTQGWRRFAEQNPQKLKETHPQEAERWLASNRLSGATLLVSTAQNTPEVSAFAQTEYERIDREIRAERATLQKELEGARAELRASTEAPATLLAMERLQRYDGFVRGMRLLFPLAGVVLIVIGLVCLGQGVSQPWRRALPLFSTTGLCAALFLILGIFAYTGTTPVQKSSGTEQESVALHIPRDLQEKEKLLQEETSARNATAGLEATKPTEPQPTTSPTPPSVLGPTVPMGGGLGGPTSPPPLPVPPGAGGFAGGGAGFGGFGRAGIPLPGGTPARPVAPGYQFGLAKDKAMEKKLGTKQEMDAGDQFTRKFPPPRVPEQAKRDLRLDDRADFQNRGLLGSGKAGASRSVPRFLVREYAHLRSEDKKGSELRTDFTQTVYWHPVLVLPGGTAEVAFALSDAVTTYQVTAFGHTLDGRLGAATLNFNAQLPFSLAPMTPIEVTASDRVTVPLTVSNTTNTDRIVQVELRQNDGLKLTDGKAQETITVPANRNVQRLYGFAPTLANGQAHLAFTGKAQGLSDALERTFRIVPDGFPVTGSFSDLLEGSARHHVPLPKEWIKGSLECQVQVFPSTLADLQKGLEGLLREPNGCFEQTSTTNYPNVLILQYLKATDQANPEAERRARELLSRGYGRLTSFECQNTEKKGREGYEWFGGTAPPHEALTAYGLLQFRDMAKVQPVDAAMLARTRAYLLSRKDGHGGFLRNPRAIDSFGRAPDHITNAYIVWALTESGSEDDVKLELETLQKKASDSKDPYFLALVANSLLNRNLTRPGNELLEKLVKLQKADGHLEGTEGSITGSGGRDLQIETTSLAVLGWLRSNPASFNPAIQAAIKWIGQQRGGSGAFGSTQSTILALKALISYTQLNKRPVRPGTLSLYVENKCVASKSFTADLRETLTLNLTNPETILHSGKNNVRIEISGENYFPYSLSWSYRTRTPISVPDAPVRLQTTLERTNLREGDSVRLKVKLENVSGKGQGMTVAIVGLPGGLNLPDDLKQLREHMRLPVDGSRPLLSMYEIRGRELVLYWRDLAPNQKIEVPLDLICRLPGTYSGPASRAYLYYNADHKAWIEPLQVTIQPRGE